MSMVLVRTLFGLHLSVINENVLIGEGTDDLSLVEVKKGLVKRSIDQLGFIKDVNSLVVLSGASLGSQLTNMNVVSFAFHRNECWPLSIALTLASNISTKG